MAEETNRELALRYFVATHNTPWDPDVITELCGPDFGERQRQWLVMEHAAFPDIAATVEDVVAAGEKVVLRHVLRGTHRDDFRTPLGTLPASGNRIEVPAI